MRNIYWLVVCLKCFLFSQFTGTWYFLYHLGSKEDDNIGCVTDNYGVSVANSSKITIYLRQKVLSKVEVTDFITFKMLNATLVRYTLTGSNKFNGSSLKSRDFKMKRSGKTGYLILDITKGVNTNYFSLKKANNKIL